MPRIKIEILGLRKLSKALRQYPKIAGKNVQKAINKSILEVEKQAKPITPIDTGFLRSSYRREFKPLKGILKVIANYAVYVHEGTIKWPLSMPPKNPATVRQFLKIGIDRSTKNIAGYFEKALKATVKKIALKAK